MTASTATISTPSIYVSVLADYNAGIHHGMWISLEKGVEYAQKMIRRLLRTSPTARQEGRRAEEWAIHAAEGFENVHIGEHEDLEELIALAEALEEHGPAFAAFYDYAASGTDVATCISQFEEDYQGTYHTIKDFAEQYADDIALLADMPENLRYYFDYEAWGRDLELSGDIFTARTPEGLAVFGHY